MALRPVVWYIKVNVLTLRKSSGKQVNTQNKKKQEHNEIKKWYLILTQW